MNWRSALTSKTLPWRGASASEPAPEPTLPNADVAARTVSAPDSADFRQFKARVLRKTGIDLDLYKPQQMHRRLWSMVERTGAGSFMAYFDQMEHNPEAITAFVDRLTINVSELFRNPEKWRELQNALLPGLLQQRNGLKVWSAGCSYGAEPYSLAILLETLAPDRPHTLHATDLDRSILALARAGEFTRADMKNLDDATRDRYFLPIAPAVSSGYEGRYRVRDDLRARVQFRAHNLLADGFEGGYDLICCRNVVIYFTDAAKDGLFARLAQALAPGGILFVGGTERIFNAREIGLTSPLPFFYQRA